MSYVRIMYDRLFREYIRSLDDPGRDWDDNPAEQSVIYQYFFENRLLPAGVNREGYVTEDKDMDKLSDIYNDWTAALPNTNSKRKRSGSGINTDILMAGYSRLEASSEQDLQRERLLYVRLLFEYMCEDPVRYRKGHVYVKEDDPKVKLVYISGMVDLLKLSGRDFSEDEKNTVLNVRKVCEDVLEALRNGEKEVTERVQNLSRRALKIVTDRIIRTALHETIKGFFRDMGYLVSESEKRPDFYKRKVNKTVELLEFCENRMEKEEDGSYKERYDRDDCDTLLDIMNLLGRKSGYDKAVVPVKISPYGHMISIVGRSHYTPDMNMIMEKRMSRKDRRTYNYAVITPYYDYENDNDFALCHEICNEFGDLKCYTDAEELFNYYNEDAMDVVIENNSEIFGSGTDVEDNSELISSGIAEEAEDGINDAFDMIPPVFRGFFRRINTREEEIQRTFAEEKEMLKQKEDEYINITSHNQNVTIL